MNLPVPTACRRPAIELGERLERAVAGMEGPCCPETATGHRGQRCQYAGTTTLVATGAWAWHNLPACAIPLLGQRELDRQLIIVGADSPDLVWAGDRDAGQG